MVSTTVSETRSNKMIFNLLTPQGFLSLSDYGTNSVEDGKSNDEPYAPLALGRTVVSANIIGVVSDTDISAALARHQYGDWGEVCDSDWNLNDSAVKHGDLISTFYPNGERVEFAEAAKVGKALLDSPVRKLFSDDEQTRIECLNTIEAARKKGSASIDVDFFCTLLYSQEHYCVDYNACIMFKPSPEGEAVYIREGFEHDGVMLRFLVGTDPKVAYLVLDDFEAKDRFMALKGKISSYVPLSELHAVISGHDYNTNESVCFYINFSQEDERCFVEKIFDINKGVLDQLFPPVEQSVGDNDTPALASSEGDEAVTGDGAEE